MHLTFDWSTTLRRVRGRTNFVPDAVASAGTRCGWKRFPFGDRIYRYGGDALATNWARLHAGDAEPHPDVAALGRLVRANPALGARVPDLAAAARDVEEAWRAYHAGDFAEAVDRGEAAGPVGTVVAARAAIVYATHLEEDEMRRAAILRDTVDACSVLVELAPNWANAWFVNGLAIGRYCQHVPLVRSLARGLGGKSRESLQRALQLEPGHADAHAGLGIYCTEVIDKVGAMVAALTYGVKKETAIEHFEAARALNPRSPTTLVEYARAQMLAGGPASLGRAHAIFAEAAACQPLDAQARLDVEWARAELAA